MNEVTWKLADLWRQEIMNMPPKPQPKPAATKNDDAEFSALATLYQTLKQFDATSRERMLVWLSSKLGVAK